MGSVKYLLDTHTLLWAIRDNSKLSNNAITIIEDVENTLCVSAISAYEIMYKHQLGKLPEYAYLAENYFDILHDFSVSELQISAKHAHFAGKFYWTHRDPFDRLLAAQTFVENLNLITNDSAFNSLQWINTVW